MKSRGFKELAILGMVIAIIAVAALDKKPTSYPPVTLKMTQATTDELLWKVAEMEHLTVVGKVPVPPSEREYREDYSFVDTPVEEVLAKTYSEWKLVGGVLVVTPTFGQIDYCRMEYLLEEAPAEELIPLLQQAFPATRLTPHPTMNGFFASGTKDDLLEIKRFLRAIDYNPIPPLPQSKRLHRIQWLDPTQLQSELRNRFPKVSIQITDEGLEFEGSLLDTGPALAYTRYRDRRTVEVPVSLGALKKAPPTCLLEKPVRTTTVHCPPNSHGPLQLLGLQNGDVLPDYYNDPLRTKPEWWVQRGGKDYRIVLKLEP